MNTNIEQIRVYSEYGNPKHPLELVAEMDGTNSNCPITFYSEGNPVFSLGSDEVAEFCKEISKLVP